MIEEIQDFKEKEVLMVETVMMDCQVQKVIKETRAIKETKAIKEFKEKGT